MIRHSFIALLLAAAPAALAAHLAGQSHTPPGTGVAPVSKDRLLVAPSGAAHYVVVSDSAKHGDIWRWKQADGATALRYSQSLRGWITETDTVVRYGTNGLPVALTVRGVSPNGDAAEQFALSPDGQASWSSASEKGSGKGGEAYYLSIEAPPLIASVLMERLAAAGETGVPTLPSGRAILTRASVATIAGPNGPEQLELAFVRGLGLSPSPVWLKGGQFWGSIGTISMVPAGYEAHAKRLRELQETAEADSVKSVSRRFLSDAARAPVLFDNVRLFDADGGQFLADRAVLIEGGKIKAIGAAGSLKGATGTRVIDGRGKTLVPGLWDAHRHMGGDFDFLSNLANGITSFRSPGDMIDRAVSVRARRQSGDLLVGEGWAQAIVDKKDPLAAQGSETVSSAAEAIAAVRKIKAAGLWGVKFYTSMDPAWIAPAAAEAHRLGLHVSGHVPARMRPLEAVRAGYDELTHINFVVMQLMPQSVVDKANTAARIEGPAKYARGLDLAAPEAQAMLAELKRSGTVVDPTLVVFEHALTKDGGAPDAAYAPYARVVPATLARGFNAGGHPLIENLTRDDYRASFAKLLELTGRLHRAGVPIVAGTDGEGMELVRELELYQKAGMSAAAAIQTATINVARLVGADKRTGSIAVGKEADMILVDGDPSRELGALRRIDQVVMDGTLMSGEALRTAAGYSGRPL